MTAQPLTNSPIVAAYLERTPGSAALYERAKEVLPGGVTHDSRYIRPHPLSVVRAAGARKWDVDGHEYVDYHGGHGALILGHTHPEVMDKVAAQLGRGTHYGSSQELEIRWAELVCELVPSAELVRFTSSGTEATLLALRLARAHTGRDLLLRLRGHFHGWHDHMAFGVHSHFDGTPTPGITEDLARGVILIDPNDEEALDTVMRERGHEIAAMIFEPTGCNFGKVPLHPSFVRRAREATAQHGVVLIFDEVVTGFRVALGGAQEMLGVTPDLTTLAKILSGGLPGGAVAGRDDIVSILGPDVAAARGMEKIHHPGTFNANPVSATAGIATLELLRDTDALERARAYGERMREGVNAILSNEGVPWVAYGSPTGCHIFTNPRRLDIDPMSFDVASLGYEQLKIPRGNETVTKLKLAMQLHGVDIAPWPGGPASAAHGDDDLERTLTAFRKALNMLRQEGEIE